MLKHQEATEGEEAEKQQRKRERRKWRNVRERPKVQEMLRPLIALLLRLRRGKWFSEDLSLVICLVI